MTPIDTHSELTHDIDSRLQAPLSQIAGTDARQLRRLRIGFWLVAVFFGATQTWTVRHAIFSDGISYIEIAKAYLNGDWASAINPYWSPLYSWVLAAAYFILRPTPYWDVSVLHLVNFGGYLASLGALEFFLRELIRYRNAVIPDWVGVSDKLLYFAGYCTILFAGLSLVSMWYCSPDMVAMALLLFLSGLLLRVGAFGGGAWTFIIIGVVCGLSFLARTAFAPVFVVCLGVLAGLKLRRGEDFVRPLLTTSAVMLAFCIPFITGISLKAGHFTIGDSGALNYGWEIDGAARYAHWQGEPGDIGRPKHPTIQVTANPNSYSFASPIPGTYPPWFNPSYWYDGIRPKFKWKPQLQVLFVNLTVLLNLFVRSAALLCVVVLLLLFRGFRTWISNLIAFWPVLVPCLTVIGLYGLLYIEKRYIAGNLVILWMLALTAVEARSATMRVWAPRLVLSICIVYTGIFVIRRQSHPVYESVRDVLHRSERYANVQFLIAQHLLHAGLHPGDKIAYIGPAVDADWARLAKVKIVAEIPLIYDRFHKPLNNTLHLDSRDVRGFWTTSPEKRAAILDGFRRAGARMLVTDGFFEREFVRNWPRALPIGLPGLPEEDPDTPHQLNTRYQWLDALSPSLTNVSIQ